MMNGELLPCPFCGSPAEIDPRPVELPDWWGCTVWCSAINTHECSAQIIAAGDTEQEAIDAAVAAWNRRTERTCHPELPMFNGFPIVNGRPHCSRCGMEWELLPIKPVYCPTCGARVVRE